MKFLVLGAGRMGYAAAYDLIRSPKVEQVIIADKDTKQVQSVVDKLSDTKIVPVELDATKKDHVLQLMARSEVTISCLPYHHNYELTKWALECKTHFVDLGGNEETVAKQFHLDEIAKEQGVTIMPDLGLAPGMASILAVVAAESMDELYAIRIRVGGVPVEPEGTLQYSQIFSMDGLLNEYVENATIIRDGKVYSVPSLTDLEKIEFPKPFGTMEAFNSSGGISTLPKSYLGKVQHLDYKTIRYPGHCSHMALIKELGLMSADSVKLPSGTKVVPRELLSHGLAKLLPQDEPDAVLIRVTVTGVKDRKPLEIVWEGIDYSNQAEGLSAMMRTTAFPASIIAQMIARGDISDRGVLAQENCVPVKLFLAELEGRGIRLTMQERAPVPHGV